jgi:hypothetical protein
MQTPTPLSLLAICVYLGVARPGYIWLVKELFGHEASTDMLSFETFCGSTIILLMILMSVLFVVACICKCFGKDFDPSKYV